MSLPNPKGFYTPAGLEITLRVPKAFALMARLYPEVDAWKVLKTVEGLELLPSSCALVFASISIANGLSIYEISANILYGSFVGSLLKSTNLSDLPGITPFARFFSSERFFLLACWIGLLVTVLNVYNWEWVDILILGAAKLLAFVIDMLCVFIFNHFRAKRIGVYLYVSDLNFFLSYKYHAEQIGVTTSFEISQEEMQEKNWKACYLDYVSKVPHIYG